MDLDGHASVDCGGDDCDDADATVNPGVGEDETWRIESVVSDGMHPELAPGRDGVVHVVFRDGSTGLSDARRDDGEWTVEQIDAATPQLGGIVQDSLGAYHVVYARAGPEPGPMLHAHGTGAGDWEVEETALVPWGPPAVTLDPQTNWVHVAYADAFDASRTAWRHSTFDGSAWTEGEALPYECRGGPVALALDGAGAVHVVHLHNCSGEFCTYETPLYSTNASGAWVTEPIDGLAAAYISLALDGGGVPTAGVISLVQYGKCDPASYALSIVRREGDAWTRGVVDEGTFEGMPGLDLASGPDGSVHLAFGSTGGLVQQESPGTSPWAPEMVDDRASSGYGWLSIAVDDAYVHIAYEIQGAALDPSSRAIAYARRSVPDGVDDDCDGVAW